MNQHEITSLLLRAADARRSLFDDPQAAVKTAAFRLFNGFLEGLPHLVIDLYAQTLVVFNYADDPRGAQAEVEAAWRLLVERMPWITTVVIKTKNSTDEGERRGVLAYGQAPSRKVREHGVWYAVDLLLNMDASLYLDTRELRGWAIANLSGKRVLNTFAYTGSLGVAAMAGGAREVIQMDLNRRFLNLAKDSYTLNGFPIQRADFRPGDFWDQAAQLNRAGALFDCVFVDPPFFSVTERGTVDLVANSRRVINKVRPLVGHGGWLVAINNALFLSGADYMRMLEEMSADGYLSVESLIPIPPDFTGYPETRVGDPPADPTPFNHSTKIAILRVKRKDGRTSKD